MPRKIFILFVLFLFIRCQDKETTSAKISLNKNWIFKGVDTLNWNSASVPGTVFTDLLDHKLIQDPFIKNNESEVQWVPKKDWVYQTTFDVDDKLFAHKNIELIFEGIDTYAEIYLNDHLLGKTDNAFRSWTYDIKALIKKRNTLRILLKNFDEIEQIKKARYPYSLPEGNRIFTRKAQFQYGWDWGPKLNAMGIWKPVYLHVWNDYKLNSVFLKQENITKNETQIQVVLDEKKQADEQLSYEIYLNDTLKTKTNIPEIHFNIKNPRLWWTHNLGEPYLYDVKVIVKKENKIVDSCRTKLGIRTIELITKNDEKGSSFYFELNGKPIYIKGANYIPQHSFQNKVTEDKYQKLLDDVVNANMNMLRVWGGGIYENDLFYDLCDQKGILVWQDFMFACAMYPGDPEFLKNVSIEAEQRVKRLRNHPSIALWCGNNENSEGWHRWGWQANRSEQEKEAIWTDYLALFDSILPNTVERYSQTDYWESSPKFGRGNPKYEFEGDAHDWWVWHDGYPFEHLEKHVPRFMSEFGFQSYPSDAVLKYINQEENIHLSSPIIQSHQKHIRGFEIIQNYLESDFPIPENEDDYVYASQLLQARGITMGIKAHRRAKPYNMGTLYWQLNDCWPAISWSSIDYLGNWKALHYKVKKAYQNLLISTVKEGGAYNTYLVNDNFQTIRDTLHLRVMDFHGNEIWANKIAMEALPNSSQLVHQLPRFNFDKRKSFLWAKFGNTEEVYLFKKPKELRLPKAEIEITTKEIPNGYTVQLFSKTFQKDVFLATKTKGTFSENYVDLLPNTSRKITFKTSEKQLDLINVKSLSSIKDKQNHDDRFSNKK